MFDRDVVHAFSDLPDLSRLDQESWGWPKNWGKCILGGHLSDQGIPDGTECVTFYEMEGDNITTHYYPIPDNVRFLLRDAKARQADETRQKIRSALGL
jgi:hypothetical protein